MKIKSLLLVFVLIPVLAVIYLVNMIWITRVEAQPNSPFSDFKAMSIENLETLQVKLTYVGVQDKVIATVAFTSPSNTLDISKFIPFRRPGIQYANDDIAVNTCTASPTELKTMIQNISSLQTVTNGDVAADVFLSFGMFNSIDSKDKAFEAILNRSDTIALFEQIKLALQANQDCLEVLAAQQGAMGF